LITGTYSAVKEQKVETSEWWGRLFPPTKTEGKEEIEKKTHPSFYIGRAETSVKRALRLKKNKPHLK